VVFEGEVRRAPGLLEDAEQCSEVILFTLEEAILAGIEEFDKAMG
jgi:hypothetical protein